jgi:LytR cell envelope-related transcriptional attenuator
MDASLPAPADALIRPWRRATILATLIAAVELVALCVAGFALLAKPLAHALGTQAQAHAFAPAKHVSPGVPAPAKVAAAKLTRFQTHVYVLNGNGRAGAASDAASSLSNHGYSISGTGNAPRDDYATTVVMFKPGFHGEALRLARDLHLKVVGPLDGLKPRQLMGAQIAIVLGAG